ncbi:LmeA family phospholipid-binding protein [Microbacterium sp. Se63.02b]|uniref:LmeA family phospholipid-binding protein n=1 Tax=Microbacterium sp. Se63.02b TaxID=2709304 RepID=UPI001FCE3B18|nr:LmeA family phospholipid-binding protein [Microbacterium sp. Se63.02b]
MSDDNHTLPYPDASAEHPTLVIPGSTSAAATDAAPRTRRRWPWVVLIVVVVLALLVVAAEFIARAVLPGIVRSIVVEQLDLPADQQLDVETEGLLLPQLIGGSLDTLHLSTDSVTLEGITGAADVTATGVPLRGGDLGGASGTIRIDQEEFTSLLSGTDLPIESVEFAAPNATVGGSIDVFGSAVPLSLTLTPGAVDGDLELTRSRPASAGSTSTSTSSARISVRSARGSPNRSGCASPISFPQGSP